MATQEPLSQHDLNELLEAARQVYHETVNTALKKAEEHFRRTLARLGLNATDIEEEFHDL